MSKEIGRFVVHGEFVAAKMTVPANKLFKFPFGANGNPDEPHSEKLTIQEIMDKMHENLVKDYPEVYLKATSVRGGVILIKVPQNAT